MKCGVPHSGPNPSSSILGLSADLHQAGVVEVKGINAVGFTSYLRWLHLSGYGETWTILLVKLVYYSIMSNFGFTFESCTIQVDFRCLLMLKKKKVVNVVCIHKCLIKIGRLQAMGLTTSLFKCEPNNNNNNNNNIQGKENFVRTKTQSCHCYANASMQDLYGNEIRLHY